MARKPKRYKRGQYSKPKNFSSTFKGGDTKKAVLMSAVKRRGINKSIDEILETQKYKNDKKKKKEINKLISSTKQKGKKSGGDKNWLVPKKISKEMRDKLVTCQRQIKTRKAYEKLISKEKIFWYGKDHWRGNLKLITYENISKRIVEVFLKGMSRNEIKRRSGIGLKMIGTILKRENCNHIIHKRKLNIEQRLSTNLMMKNFKGRLNNCEYDTIDFKFDYFDLVNLIKKYYLMRFSMKQICEYSGIHKTTISRILRKGGVKTRNHGERKKIKKYFSRIAKFDRMSRSLFEKVKMGECSWKNLNPFLLEVILINERKKGKSIGKLVKETNISRHSLGVLFVENKIKINGKEPKVAYLNAIKNNSSKKVEVQYKIMKTLKETNKKRWMKQNNYNNFKKLEQDICAEYLGGNSILKMTKKFKMGKITLREILKKNFVKIERHPKKRKYLYEKDL